MYSAFCNFSSSQRLRYVSQTGAEPSGAGGTGSVQEGLGQDIGHEKENDAWGYDVADAATEAATDVDKTPTELSLWFEVEVMGWWEEERWIQNFRMKKRSFL